MPTPVARSFYSNSIAKFLTEEPSQILGKLAAASSSDDTGDQKNAWLEQIRLLQRTLPPFQRGHILFEYSIPRIGKRIDNIIILDGIIFVIEFKVRSSGEAKHQLPDIEQVTDYALDLKYFHSASRDAPIIPILFDTHAQSAKTEVRIAEDMVSKCLPANQSTFEDVMKSVLKKVPASHLDPVTWERAHYSPTPTIIEAACELYRTHAVLEISRSDAANLTETTDALSLIIREAKSSSQKSICFVTGVPGSGKTLAGLNLAIAQQNQATDEHATFLSGNGPLVQVLQEALARSTTKESQIKTTKKSALRKVNEFVQPIHRFRDEGLRDLETPPTEKVIIFDEAQRAWSQEQTADFMRRKRKQADFSQSEPQFLISYVNRHKNWAVVICLVGGGQEINTGEAGLSEWFKALATTFPDWHVHVSDRLTDSEYAVDEIFFKSINPSKLHINNHLHLATSIRSFRSEHVSNFVKALLDCDIATSIEMKKALKEKYPLVLTRNLDRAKEWVKTNARGSERYGLVASSGAKRLRPLGITVQAEINPANWFLNPSYDVRSSYYLEEVATEFDVQGLELDWTIVGWDADFRFTEGAWRTLSFSGFSWKQIKSPVQQGYRKNSYRVLLTRARQGMVIFIPLGDSRDNTRRPEFYDGTYNYLRQIGVEEI
ncbi:MAG: DUF2075 domain-containing protein [Chloroflexi bacterium]|nr:DUF2075 domain-containing protein [Chloroflexota bacterium]